MESIEEGINVVKHNEIIKLKMAQIKEKKCILF